MGTASRRRHMKSRQGVTNSKQATASQAMKPTSPVTPKYHEKKESPWSFLKKVQPASTPHRHAAYPMTEKTIVNAPTKPPMNAPAPKNNTAQLPQVRGATANQISRAPLPITYRPVNMHPDDAFFSGAWLFDMARAPVWFQREIARPSQRPSSRPQSGLAMAPARNLPQPMQSPRDKVSPRTEKARLLTDDEKVFELVCWLFDWHGKVPPTMPKVKQMSAPRPISGNASPQPPVDRNYKNRPASATVFMPQTTMKTKVMPSPPKASLKVVHYAHPDDVFYSGAWLFNSSTEWPGWLKQELGVQARGAQKPNVVNPNTRPNQKSAKLNQAPIQSPRRVADTDPDITFYSGAWLFDEDSRPLWLEKELCQPLKSKVPQPKVKNEMTMHRQQVMVKPQSPDIGFESGAWLFDPSAAPAWLKACLIQNAKPNTKAPQVAPNKKMNMSPRPMQQNNAKPQSREHFFESANRLFYVQDARQSLPMAQKSSPSFKRHNKAKK